MGGLGFRVQGFGGFGVWGLGFRGVWGKKALGVGLGIRVQRSFGFRV